MGPFPAKYRSPTDCPMNPMKRSPQNRDEVIPALAEVFREHGFEGTKLSIITKSTGLGKGSLYHFFPGGKEEMADAVLGHVNTWFEEQIFSPLADADEPIEGLHQMLRNVDDYFQSGQRLCIIGVFAIGEACDRLSIPISAFFDRWREVLIDTLHSAGLRTKQCEELALEVLVGIQGGLIVSRAVEDNTVFTRTIDKLRTSLAGALLDPPIPSKTLTP